MPETTPLGIFAERRHPYYIFAADFRDTSTGVTTLHYLCHALNCSGEAAFLLNTSSSKPGLNVRFLSANDCWYHKASKAVPIMVYPEIVSDNPYNALAVVRYMLNGDGVLTGRKIQKGEFDLTFYYGPQFVPKDCRSAEILTVPVLHDSLFVPTTHAVQRTKKILFLSRAKRSEVDLSLFPSEVEVLDARNPKTLPELAALFQQASVLYSYENSGTCTYAMFAGCPVLYVRNSALTELPLMQEFHGDGYAFIDEPGGFERAQATVGKVRQHWQATKDEFPKQLKHFIDRTQELATLMSRGNPYCAMHIMQRIFPDALPPAPTPEARQYA
jgi:hypothetical protein